MKNFEEQKLAQLMKDLKESVNLSPSNHFVNHTEDRLLGLYSQQYPQKEQVYRVKLGYAFTLASIVILILTAQILDSLPGDILYPVKLASERVILSVVPEDTKTKLNDTLQQKRQEEVKRVESKNVKGTTDQKLDKPKEDKNDKKEQKSNGPVKQETQKQGQGVTKKEKKRSNIQKRLLRKVGKALKGGESKRK